MNKKFIALAVAALVSGAANAAAVYENDTTTFNLSGEMDAYLSTYDVDSDTAANDKSYDPDIDLWAKVQVDAEHQLNETVKVFGSFEVENGVGFVAGGDSDKGVTTDDEYFGAMFGEDFGVAVGEVGDFGDSLGALVIDNTNEGTGYVDDNGKLFESEGHAISAKYAANGLELIADTYLSEDEDTDEAYGVSASYSVSGFNIGAAYQDRGNRSAYDYDTVVGDNINDGDNEIYGFVAGYEVADFSVSAHYVVDTIDDVDTDVIGVAADYTIDATRLYVSGYTADQDGQDEDLTAYTLGADYAFSDNLKGFVEYTAEDNADYVDGDETTLAVAGMYFTF